MSKARALDPVGAAFAIGVPLLAAAVTLGLTALWQDRLPAALATHWGSGSAPDGFSSPWSNSWFVAALIVLIGGGCAATAGFARAQLMLRRVMLVTGLTLTGLIFTVNTVLMSSQLGLHDASEARLEAWSIGAGVLLGIAVGVVGSASLQDLRPRVRATAGPDAALPRAAHPALPIAFTLGVSDRVVGAVCGLVGVGALIACLAAGSLWPLPIFIPALLLLFATARFRVEADERGVRVRTAGAAVLTYNLDEVAAARVVAVDPFRDFGGWGLRFTGKGRYGVVTAKGPAVQVSMAGGDVLTISTERAEELAGALNTLADRR